MHPARFLLPSFSRQIQPVVFHQKYHYTFYSALFHAVIYLSSSVSKTEDTLSAYKVNYENTNEAPG